MAVYNQITDYTIIEGGTLIELEKKVAAFFRVGDSAVHWDLKGPALQYRLERWEQGVREESFGFYQTLVGYKK